MAFGGYKFYGYHRGATTNATLDTHVSRVAAFVMANAAANSSWSFDPDRLDGYYQITFDGNSYNAIHRLKNDSDTELGYATFFKYYDGNSGLTGYYVILTVEKIGFANRGGRPQSGYINFYFDQWCCPRGNNYPWNLNAFCVHALSLEPFGDLPVNGSLSSDFIPTKSIRLSPVGAPTRPNSGTTAYVADELSSFIYVSDAYFGYAIRGCDIISFATVSTTAPSIHVLSLNAFSKYLNKGDSYGLLDFPVNAKSSQTNEISSPTKNSCGYGQFLDETGTDICCNCTYYSTSSDTQYAAIYYSGISSYNRDSVSDKVQITGCEVGLVSYNIVVMQSGALGKGITNPELLSLCINSPSGSQSDHSIGETFNSGNQLICFFNASNYVYYLCDVGNTQQSNYQVLLLCGWDASNPDIRQATSWNEFDVTDWVPTT